MKRKSTSLIIMIVAVLIFITFLFHKVGYCEMPGWEGAGDDSVSSTECSKIGGRYVYQTKYNLIFGNK